MLTVWGDGGGCQMPALLRAVQRDPEHVLGLGHRRPGALLGLRLLEVPKFELSIPLAEHEPASLSYTGHLQHRRQCTELDSALGPSLLPPFVGPRRPRLMHPQSPADTTGDELARACIHGDGPHVVRVAVPRVAEDPAFLAVALLAEGRDLGIDAAGQQHAAIWGGREGQDVGLVLREAIAHHASDRVPDVHQAQAVTTGQAVIA
mmetsp:Transcript_56598/g.184062  ORF Transcript_56598/g.184062 Transcript_56598/m.184062 type:complete len:205 (-) Transcript_56598:708-1322(-)